MALSAAQRCRCAASLPAACVADMAASWREKASSRDSREANSPSGDDCGGAGACAAGVP